MRDAISQEDALELLIDKESLSGLLDQIAEVCHLKAEHIQSNWQDEPAAKRWASAATKIQILAASLAAKGL